MRVITIAQQKGGAGKTSLAAHMAIAWAGLGLTADDAGFHPASNDNGPAKKAASPMRITLMDLDPQGSLSDWFRVRQDNLPEDSCLSVVSAVGWRASGAIERAKATSDIVLIDTPPHADAPTIRCAIRAADLVVVPTQLSPMDIWACQATLDVIAKERKPAVIVLNRVPPRARLASELIAELEANDLPLAKAYIGNRILFASSLMEGKGVTEAEPHSVAAAEIRLLAGEVLRKVA